MARLCTADGGRNGAHDADRPPYNVEIEGNVSRTGKHRAFAMGSGEMSSDAFTAFLTDTLGAAVQVCSDGAVAFVFMDWRHMDELKQAGSAVFAELKNLCVWVKTNAGMGSFYRSQHELIFVYKVGQASHQNHFGLGASGRSRTNVWTYPGAKNSKDGREALAHHPTPKTVAMLEDAIKDVSKRNQIVLDPFGGSGSTLIAAERCGRRAFLLEIDPLYADVIVRRFEIFTGKKAVLESSGESFEAVAASRASA